MIKNVIEYLENSAKTNPDKVAFVDQHQEITYAQLMVDAKKIASAINDKLGRDVINYPIAVYMEKSVDALITFFGILYSGNYYCPIDVNMPPERKNKIIEVLKPVLIIKRKNMLDDWSGEQLCYDEAMLMEAGLEDYQNYKQILDIDPIYVLFTSGSTGIPKGVVISHRGVIDYVEWLKDKFDFNEETVFGNQAPFYFDNSVLDIYSTIKNASTMVIIPEAAFMLPNKLVDYLNQKKINTLFWVPSALIGVADSGILDSVQINYVDKILFCGEIMPCKQLNIWRKHYPKALYANLYGPTEITDVCSYYIIDRLFEDDESLPIGKACENMDIIVLNENNEKCSIGEAGELCVRGCGLSMGYFSNWDKTKEAFIQNPLNNNYRDIIYRTGDIAYINEKKEIIYVGRKDFQIKYQGNRIELGEIEAALGDCSGVKQGCAIYDEISKKIILYCVIDKEKISNEKSIYAYLRKKVPKYMLPKDIEIIDKFPLNLNGKIDRLELKKMWSEKYTGK